MLKVNQLRGFGRYPIIEVGGGISYIGEDEAQSEGCSIGSTGRISGDLLLWSGSRVGTDLDDIPADFTEIGTQVTEGTGGSGIRCRRAWKFSDGTETTITTGGLVFCQGVIILRGIHAVSPIGDNGNNHGNSTTMTYGTRTLASASSWVVCFGHANIGGSMPTPSGMTGRSLLGSSFGSFTIGPTGTFTSRTTTISNLTRWLTFGIEVLAS